MTLAPGRAEEADSAKAAHRRRIRADRRERMAHGDAPISAQPLLDLLAHRPDSAHRSVACYLSMPGEPDTQAIIDALHEAAIPVLVPKVHGPDLTWHELTPTTPIGNASRGPAIREAMSPSQPAEALSQCSLIVLPALAADRSGHRLGQGGGYFDRALAHVAPLPRDRRPMLVAVVFDSELMDAFPIDLCESHDVPVDAILTETQLVICEH